MRPVKKLDNGMKAIPFSRVSCGGKELDLIREVLESGWLTTAGKTLLFEKNFAKAVNTQFACAVNSCTAAMHLALDALGIGPGDKVLVPTMTFTATAEVIRYLGADPVFLDIEYGTNLVTPDIVQAAIEQYPSAKALMVVHYGGQAAEMISENKRGILDICREHQIKVVEDAAHAFPTRHLGQMVGSIGDVTCFSFYANKTITTGEGGMLTTSNPEIAERVKLMRLHGINRDIWNRYTSDKPSWEYDVIEAGYKYNMPDINAAIGLAQLEQAETFRRERERCALFYLEALKDIDCIDLPTIHSHRSDHAWHLLPIFLKPETPVARNRFIELMADAGIGTSVHYKPLHRMTYYQKRYKLDTGSFPNAERAWRGSVSLPIYPSLSPEALAYICSTIKGILH
jgi:dTDP-4-amino-4,6-dideoxygalactose transaminase